MLIHRNRWSCVIVQIVQCSLAHCRVSLSDKNTRFFLITFFDFLCSGGTYPGRRKNIVVWMSRYLQNFFLLPFVDRRVTVGSVEMVGVKVVSLGDSVISIVKKGGRNSCLMMVLMAWEYVGWFIRLSANLYSLYSVFAVLNDLRL